MAFQWLFYALAEHLEYNYQLWLNKLFYQTFMIKMEIIYPERHFSQKKIQNLKIFGDYENMYIFYVYKK